MVKQLLKSSVLLLAAAVFFLVVALVFSNWRFPGQSSGSLVFAETYRNGYRLNRIVLSSPQGQVTIEQKQGYWRVAEADDYFANIDLLNRLLTDINTSTFYSEQTFADPDKDKLQGVRVQTFHNNHLLNNVLIGRAAENEQYHFAQTGEDSAVWLVDGTYNLPPEFYSWIMQPVSELPPELVERVEADNLAVSRQRPGQAFAKADGSSADVAALLEAAAYVIAENVRQAEHFDSEQYPKQRLLRFTTFQGLIVEYDLRGNDQEFWLSINLSATPLPKQEVNAYITENRIFYDGWYFKLPAALGQMLFTLPLR